MGGHAEVDAAFRQMGQAAEESPETPEDPDSLPQ
jgi:hypothetical protein